MIESPALSATRLGVVQRLADPYLTDHDRWVLRQFARFLGGLAPEPDLRVVAVRAERPLRTQRSLRARQVLQRDPRWPRV